LNQNKKGFNGLGGKRHKFAISPEAGFLGIQFKGSEFVEMSNLAGHSGALINSLTISKGSSKDFWAAGRIRVSLLKGKRRLKQ
jgi:hypothetical protein